MKRAATITGLFVFCAAAVTLTACTSSGSTAPATATPPAATTVVTTEQVTATVPPSTPPPTSTPASSSRAPAPSAPTSSASGPQDCTNKQLSVGHRYPSGATGHGGVIVIFTNTASSTCTLFGYPGAAALDSAGKQFEQAKRTRSGFLGGCGCAPHTVTLRPGAKASALIEGDNGGGDECLRDRGLLVTPPNTTHSTRIQFMAYACGLTVHPTVAGTSGGINQ
jgi:hypothetical protein